MVRIMERVIGNFKYEVVPYKDEDEKDCFQFIVLSLTDPLFNLWQAETIELVDNEADANLMAISIIEALQQKEMLVEEEEVI